MKKLSFVCSLILFNLSAHAWLKPAIGTRFAIQYDGLPYIDIEEAKIQIVDLFDISTEDINRFKSKGKQIVCYFSGGTYEAWRSDAGTFPGNILGNTLAQWNERWLDIRNPRTTMIMEKRLDLAVSKGCNGVDIDNLDEYPQNSGLPITYNDQLFYNRTLADLAHKKNLGVGLKNDLNQIPDLVDYFDWQINEECFQYGECEMVLPFIEKGKAVFNIEFIGDPKEFCPIANEYGFSSIKKRLSLDGWVESCSQY